MNTNASQIAIKELFSDYHFVVNKLIITEMSVAQNLQRHLTKMLIIACASYYENEITRSLKDYSVKQTKRYKIMPHGFDITKDFSFFRMFDFGKDMAKNVNAFLQPMKFLGSEFKESLILEVNSRDDVSKGLHAFQTICCLRNSLVHNDLISFTTPSDKTFDDINKLHDDAIVFVSFLIAKFN